MKEGTREDVRDYLQRVGDASLKDMTNVLPYSRNTIRQALTELGAVEDTSWPRRWSFPEGWEEPTHEVLPWSIRVDLKVPSKPMLPLHQTLPVWNSQRDELIETIDSMTSETSQEVFLTNLKTLATVFSEVYRNVYAVRNEPDWRAQLGAENV